MTTNAIAAASAAPTSSLTGTQKSIADNFDTFLSLLTTQLKNQNPLDPLDTNQFTQQLVQFSSVEQQLKTNQFLEALVNAGQSSGANKAAFATEAIAMIGKTVVAGSAVTDLKNGEANWTYTVPDSSPAASITIRNDQNQVVFETDKPLPAGLGTFKWDGKDATGNPFPEGNYSITIDAQDANGNSMTVLTQTKGVVQSADLSGDEPVLIVGPSRIQLSSVLSVSPT